MREQLGAESGPVSLLVDARGIDASGIGRYLREVLKRVLHDPRFSRVVLAGNPVRLQEFARDTGGDTSVEITDFDHPFYSPAAQLRWPRLLRSRSSSTDLTFLPHYDGPLIGLSGRSVVTVQDLIHFKVPEAFPLPKRIAAGLLLDRVCKQAGVVLVTSEATRRDLNERLPFTRQKTEVVPLGISDFFRRARDGNAREVAGLPSGVPYLLCVGNRKPHKNLVAAVETLARLKEEYLDLHLVIAGRAYDGAEQVMRRAGELQVANRVVEIDSPSDGDLLALYSGCSALLFPSLYEGFGLPVLEAMGCGAPVVASDRSSIPEVAGEAALLVDPTDHSAMAAAAARLLADKDFRGEMVARGMERAAMFTWERTAEAVADLLVRSARGSVRAASALKAPAATSTGSRA